MGDSLIAIQPYLLNLAKSLTKDINLAEDLLQDTNVKVLAKIMMFKPGTNFKAWCSRIMKNLFINDYRRETCSPVDFVGDIFHDKVYDGRDVFMAEDITNAINSLSPIYKESISHYLAGYKYQEIANKLSLPIGTVKSRIFIAKKELRNKLKVYQYTYA